MKKRYWIIIGIALIIIDQLTKILVINKNITVIPNFFSITYTENLGAAFGIGNSYIILILNIIIIALLAIFIIKENKKIENYLPYILIISGSIGNIIDRIFRGYVIDFLDFNIFNFPNFNLADICIVIGIFYLLFEIIKKYIIKNLKK